MPLNSQPQKSIQEMKIPYSGFSIAHVDVPDNILDETSTLESFQTESLLSPSLETTVKIQSTIHNQVVKDYDQFREAEMVLISHNPNIDDDKKFTNSQTIYRMSNRVMVNYNVEEFILHACDPTLINNHLTRISDFYRCKSPTEVAGAALTSIGAVVDLEESAPRKDYQATNLHPFQILSEQADTALAGGNDPSFLHFMTFHDGGSGIHNFKSLYNMTKQPSKWIYVWNEKGMGMQLGNPHNIMHYEFPCDFDLLTDILNGVGADGSNQTTVTSVGTFNFINSLVGTAENIIKLSPFGGMGTSINKPVTTDHNLDGCPTQVEQYIALRQARLSMIRPEDTALRLTVPYNGYLHAGDIITARFPSKYSTDLDYGSGDYIIVSLTHNIKGGGYGVTILDLASQSIGRGIV